MPPCHYQITTILFDVSHISCDCVSASRDEIVSEMEKGDNASGHCITEVSLDQRILTFLTYLARIW